MDGYGKWRPPLEFMLIKYCYLTISILTNTFRVFYFL
jgi:hypothetical protein